MTSCTSKSWTICGAEAILMSSCLTEPSLPTKIIGKRTLIRSYDSMWSLLQTFYNKLWIADNCNRYPKWDSAVQASQGSYLHDSCTNNRARDNLGGPTIVTEFSVSPADRVEWQGEFEPNWQKDFYRRWFAAQVGSYERNTAGWVFWSWKTELGGDYRWSYKRKYHFPFFNMRGTCICGWDLPRDQVGKEPPAFSCKTCTQQIF